MKKTKNITIGSSEQFQNKNIKMTFLACNRLYNKKWRCKAGSLDSTLPLPPPPTPLSEMNWSHASKLPTLTITVRTVLLERYYAQYMYLNFATQKLSYV